MERHLAVLALLVLRLQAAEPVTKPACRTTSWERKFTKHMSDILQTPGMLLEGSIVDCGAETGGESCLFADLAPERTVHAIDPLPYNIESVRKLVRSGRPNIKPIRVGLGSAERIVHIGQSKHTKSGSMLINVHHAPSFAGNESSRTFHVRRLDNLFGFAKLAGERFHGEWAGEKLAFGHFDLEGGELELLKGAKQVILRDRPVFTIEVGIGGAPYPVALQVLASLGYRAFMVPERCGIPKECRNVLCFPLERLPPAWLVNGTEPGALHE